MTRIEMDEQLGRLVILKGMPGDTDAYWDALQDIPVDVLSAAMGHALKTRAWFPAPAEIRHDCDAAKPRRPIAEHPTSRLVPVEGDRWVTIKNPFGATDPHAKDIRVQVTHDPRPTCDDCGDSGTVSAWCGLAPSPRWPWLPLKSCGRYGEHGNHDWSGPCLCAASNPVILRRKDAQRERYAHPPERAAS